jgi:hypothetical protein
MAVQNYGAIMQGAADLTAMPANAFAQGQQRRQTQEYRNSLLGMDQQRLAMDQQKFQADQEDDEEDRALYAAWAKGDWATADAIDPVSTMGYRMKQEELKKLQTPEAPPSVQFQDAPFGSKVAIGSDGRWSVIEPPKPTGGAADAPKPQLVEVPLPDGTVQKQWVAPGQSSGAPVGAPTSAQALSPKDTNTARVKLTQVKVARNQLNQAKAKYAALKDSFSAGPGGQFIPTPKGKAFDAAVDSMRGSISALTRVPGVGAMSDYETRLDQSKFPSRGNYEEVGEQQLQALEQLLNTIEQGYSELLGGKAAAPAAPAAPARRKYNPKTGKIE